MLLLLRMSLLQMPMSQLPPMQLPVMLMPPQMLLPPGPQRTMPLPYLPRLCFRSLPAG
jgi:hypothetical protein